MLFFHAVGVKVKLTHPVHKTEGLVPPVGLGADQGAVAGVGGKEAAFKLGERDVPHLGGVIFREAQRNAPCAEGVVFRAVDTHRDAILRPAVAGEGRKLFQGPDGLDILVKAVSLFPQPGVENPVPGPVDGFPVPAGDLGKQGKGQGDPAMMYVFCSPLSLRSENSRSRIFASEPLNREVWITLRCYLAQSTSLR